jgi:hypothetical protein
MKQSPGIVRICICWDYQLLKIKYKRGRVLSHQISGSSFQNKKEQLISCHLWLRQWEDMYRDVQKVPYIRMLDSDWLIAVIFFLKGPSPFCILFLVIDSLNRCKYEQCLGFVASVRQIVIITYKLTYMKAQDS